MRTELKSKIAKRMLGVQGEAALKPSPGRMNWSGRAAHIIHLDIGEPDFNTPAPIVRAGIDWLQKGKTHYAPLRVCPSFVKLSPARLSKLHQATVAPSNVLISPVRN
jgi:aspartate/methionine/tyrosine aminotransferase